MRHLTRIWQMALAMLISACVPVALPAAPPATPSAAATLDWLNWRGPHYDGVSMETNLLDDFNPAGGEGSNLLWRNEDLGGRSTPVVMDNRVYTLCRYLPATPREGERVICADATTGELLWENHLNVYLSDVPDTRVGWSAVVAGLISIASEFFRSSGTLSQTGGAPTRK